MSNMIRCDKCRKLMYADSRSPKRAYGEFSIRYVSEETYHLCAVCLKQFYTEFMGIMNLEEFDEEFDVDMQEEEE